MSKLVTNVHAGGQWYGPDYGNEADVPGEAAAEIVNPDAWEDGNVPEAAGVDDPDANSGDDLDALRATYNEVTGKTADKRWGADRLRDEIADAQAED